jgi:hypothetical protein
MVTIKNRDNNEIYFNDFDLSSLNLLTIYNWEATNLPNRDIKINKLARNNKSIITSAEYYQKEILVFGRIDYSNRELGEAVLEQLKSLVAPANGSLKLNQNGTFIKWVATLQGVTLDRVDRYQTFVLSFLCSDPIGIGVDDIEWFAQTFTTSPVTIDESVYGSFQMEPLITLMITAVTGGTAASIIVRNDNTHEGITITEDYVANDIVTIDCFNKIVMINGVRVDYSGKFPVFANYENVISYQDTFATRSVNAVGVYNARYL